jgi:SAM-dependent methyltransferase
VGFKARLDKWLRISVRRKKLDADLEFMRPYMSGRILEIGAGQNRRRGEFVPPYSNSLKWVYLDLNLAVKPNVLSSVEKLACVHSHFDTILCLEVLEYVANPKRAIKELRRVLRAGGYLILSTPFLHRMDSASDFWRFTEVGLREILNSTGFEIREVRSQGSALAVVANILKFTANSERSMSTRFFIGLLFCPLDYFLLHLDSWLSSRHPALKSFSTGYLLLAEAVS